MSAFWWAVPAAMAWFGLHRYRRDAAETLAVPAAAVLWALTIALLITWS